MSATVAADFVFQPKVWQDHIRAYFDRKLVYGAFALRDDSLRPDAGKGVTVNFPYFKAIGDAEEPAESSGLTVDNLEDDSFLCTVKEVGKAVGIKKKAFKVSAARSAVIMTEAQSQIARVHAEKVDRDLNDEIHAVGNYITGFTATTAADTFNVRTATQMRIEAFGDKSGDAVVAFIHSRNELSLLSDATSGFLKADANDPMYAVPGFRGRLGGMALVVADSVPNNGGALIAGKAAYNVTMHKMGSYGIIIKQEMEVDRDYDILQREWVVTGNEWYGVKSFHAKIHAADLKAARGTFVAL